MYHDFHSFKTYLTIEKVKQSNKLSLQSEQFRMIFRINHCISETIKNFHFDLDLLVKIALTYSSLSNAWFSWALTKPATVWMPAHATHNRKQLEKQSVSFEIYPTEWISMLILSSQSSIANKFQQYLWQRVIKVLDSDTNKTLIRREVLLSNDVRLIRFH